MNFVTSRRMAYALAADHDRRMKISPSRLLARCCLLSWRTKAVMEPHTCEIPT
jgi:hypothetical protein